MSMPFLEYLMHNISRESLTSLKISGLTIVIHLHFMPVQVQLFHTGTQKLFRLRNNIFRVELTVFADGVYEIQVRGLLPVREICSINPEILNWMPVSNIEVSCSGNFRELSLLMLVISGLFVNMPINRVEFSSLISFISRQQQLTGQGFVLTQTSLFFVLMEV